MAPETTPTPGSATPAEPRSPDLEIRQVRPSDPDALLLIEEVQQEYVRRYGSRDEAPVRDEEFVEPQGAFFVAYLQGEPVATGAWRDCPELVGDPALSGLVGTSVAEIKRMYVRPSAQRRGLARRMLAHCEAHLAAAGYDLVVLGTGMAQPEAIALYESSGYRAVPGFGHYRDTVGSRHYAKVLPAEG